MCLATMARGRHPLYFQTFQGHADLGKHALKMLTKLTHLFDDPSARVSVKRILVRIVGYGMKIENYEKMNEKLGGDALDRDGEKIIGLEMNPKEPDRVDG